MSQLRVARNDFRVPIQPSKVIVSIYNKTNDFNFLVVSLTFPQSNIPLEVGHNVFYSQILRYANICTELETFLFNLQKVFQKLIERGYSNSNLVDIIKRCLNKNSLVFQKYAILDNSTILDQFV